MFDVTDVYWLLIKKVQKVDFNYCLNLKRRAVFKYTIGSPGSKTEANNAHNMP